MRISTGYQFATYQGDMQRTQERYNLLQQQVSSGKRITLAMDDPFGTTTAVNMRSVRSALDQYAKNIDYAKGTLTFTEGAYGDAKDLMQRAYTLAVQGANNATDQSARNTMISQITDLQRQLVAVANTKGPNGQYIFAGQKNGQPPYLQSGNTLTYQGNGTPIVVESGPTDTIQATDPGEPTFTTAYNNLEQLKTNLGGGNLGLISGQSIAQMQASMDSLITLRGNVGARLSSALDQQSQITRHSEDLTQSISGVEDVDYTKTILDMKAAEAAYNAALNVASQGFGLSLLNYIK